MLLTIDFVNLVVLHAAKIGVKLAIRIVAVKYGIPYALKYIVFDHIYSF